MRLQSHLLLDNILFHQKEIIPKDPANRMGPDSKSGKVSSLVPLKRKIWTQKKESRTINVTIDPYDTFYIDVPSLKIVDLQSLMMRHARKIDDAEVARRHISATHFVNSFWCRFLWYAAFSGGRIFADRFQSFSFSWSILAKPFLDVVIIYKILSFNIIFYFQRPKQITKVASIFDVWG
jgi:hypothetical protein